MSRVFVSGKISGLDYAEVFVKFNQAEYWLKGLGHEVVNPVRICSSGWSWRKCMETCLRELVGCDAICLLQDWGDSRGSSTEYYVATQLGLRVMTFIPSRNNV